MGTNFRSGAVTGSVSAFYNKIKDFILIQSNVVKGMSLVTIARNVDATTMGGEASATWKMADFWKTDASICLRVWPQRHGRYGIGADPAAGSPPFAQL